MIDPAGRLQNRAAAEAVVSDSSRSQTPKSQSFASAFSDELRSRMTVAGETSGLPTDAAVRQQSVTRRDPGSTGSSTAATSQPSGLSGLVVTFPNAASSTASAAASTSGPTGGTTNSSSSPVSFDDAYWASQPAAVQQLRNIQDPTERSEVATQLAQEGYSIDVPIMVWGWDPAITTEARESMGYTWVPSALQQPVEVAPGLTFAGNSYNAANPPAGSIAV